MEMTLNEQTGSARRESVRRVALASMVGTSVEWYDFFIFGTASALVFGRLFFPTFSELAGTLASFASFAVGFVARPVGGLLFGHIGDRIGRKTTLVVTLTMMGLATFAMGLMPPYAVIGVWAPILMVVLRFVEELDGRARIELAMQLAQMADHRRLVVVRVRHAAFRRFFDFRDVRDEHRVVRRHRAPALGDDARRRQLVRLARFGQRLHDVVRVLADAVVDRAVAARPRAFARERSAPAR